VLRKNLGVTILALSAVYSLIDLLGWLRPPLLRMRVHGGPERLAAIALSSLSLKAVVLIVGVLLAFWPERS
jgi:cation transporter-like permease